VLNRVAQSIIVIAQIDELVAALEFIADEHGRANKTLQMLQLEAKKQVVAGAKSYKVPNAKKKGLDRIDLTLCEVPTQR